MRARKIVMGDTQKRDVKEFASQNVAKALFDVFVNHSTNIIDEEELKKDLEEAIETQGEKKYKVRVTDKKTGNSYIRWATRPKITELRGNPNIESVEMLDLYGSPEPNQSERSKGAQTASVTAGKGMNNDGNLANNYPPYNKVTRGDVIAGATGKDQMGGKKKVKEEFIGEGDNDRNDKQIKPMKGKNKCKVYDGKGGGNMMMGQGLMMHQELEGEVIAETGYSRFLKKVNSILEMAVSQNQQQLAAMAIEYIDGNMPDASEDVKKMAKMGKEELKKFASTSHEGLPEKVKEENESGCGDGEKKKEKEMDPREIPTRVNLVKNKLRAMGLKMSYEPEGEKIDEFFGPFAKPKTVLPKTTQLSGSIKSVTPGKKYPATLGGKSADVTYDKSGGRSVTPSATSPTSPKPAPKQPGVGERARQGLEASKKRLEMSYDPEGEVIDEAQQRIKRPAQYAKPRGTLDTTGIGQYPRTKEEIEKMRRGESVQPYPSLKKRRNNDIDDENPPKRKRYSGSDVD
jgi:hypothetical protein